MSRVSSRSPLPARLVSGKMEASSFLSRHASETAIHGDVALDFQTIRPLSCTPAAVRSRPQMFLGSADPTGLFQIASVIIDNTVEEAVNGYATSLHVRLHRDGSLTCHDNGRGIPIEPIPAL